MLFLGDFRSHHPEAGGVPAPRGFEVLPILAVEGVSLRGFSIVSAKILQTVENAQKREQSAQRNTCDDSQGLLG